MDNHNPNVEELLLLQRVAQRINSILDLDSLLEEVVSDVAQTFGYSRSGVLLKEEDSNELVIAAVRGWTSNYHMKGERFKIGEYGMIGHVGATREMYYAPDVTVDPYYEVSEESTRSELDIPLMHQEQLIGVFSFQHQDVNAFSESRKRLLECLAGHVATAIVNARLFDYERKEKERLVTELSEARSVQLSLFPDWIPDIPGFEVRGLCVPCREVGGDWYDYIQLRNGNLAVVLADVSGKGSGAALLMASARSILRISAERGLSPGDVLCNVNNILIKDFPKTRYVTMLYAEINPAERKISFANAGHPAPVYAYGTEAKVLDYEPGFPLGILEGSYPEHHITLEPGSRILFYTDGISEAMNRNEEEYGEKRIRNCFASPDFNITTLLNEVQHFITSPASDDMTVVMIKSQ